MEESIRAEFSISGRDFSVMSPQSLAFVGDSVYDLVIRTVMVEKKGIPAKDMTLEASMYARATAQAVLLKLIKDELTEEEKDVVRRGRNVNTGRRAKHASVTEYRLATGFEALCGWLYLKGDIKRLMHLIHLGWDRLEDET